MEARLIPCVHKKCTAAYPPGLFNQPGFRPCPSCGTRVRLEVFPALLRPLAAGAAGTTVQDDSDATCFYHPRKQAVVPCAHCGRFLCALCDVEFDGRHFCVGCLEAGRRQEQHHTLITRRVCYDDLALLFALVPLLIWPLTAVTSFVTIYIVLRYWKEPLSIVRRTRLRFVLAFLFAVPQIVLWTYLAVKLFRLIID